MSGEDREKEDLESKDSAGHEEPSGAKSEAEAPPAGQEPPNRAAEGAETETAAPEAAPAEENAPEGAGADAQPEAAPGEAAPSEDEAQAAAEEPAPSSEQGGPAAKESPAGMYRSLALVGVLILAVLGFLYVKVYLQSAGYLSGVLSDVDVQERIKAAETLSKMGEGAAPAAAALVAALQDESPAVKNYARAALEGLGGRQAEALPHLIKAIHGEQADAKVMAIGVIAKMGEAGRSAGPALIVAFKDKDASVRRAAVGALAQVAPGKETVDEMFAMLADKDGGVREEAGRALREAAKSDAEVMDRLVACAKDKKGAEQLAAVKTLGDFGPLAAPAAAVLRDLAASPAASLAIASLTALRRVAPDAPESVAVFTAALGRREDNIKATAAEALLALAAKDGKAAAALRQALPTLPKNTQSRVEQALKAVK